MALSKVAGVAPETTTAPVGSTGIIGASTASTKTPRKDEHDNFRATGESLGAQMSAEEKALEGSKRGAVAFVCALGDPRRRQDRATGKGEDGKQQSVMCWKPVGYKFKALEDITVPVIPLKNSTSLIDVAIENATEKQVKAGEEFIMNLREYGTLISKTEYNGVFNGEGRTVYLGVTFSGNRNEPLPIMRGGDGIGSIKSNMELIADGEKVKTADGKDATKYVVKPEYAEKFGILFQTRSASRSARSGGAKTNEKAVSASCLARALQDYYAKH